VTRPDPDWPPSTAPPTCYNHPDRVAGSVCRRCGRPICPECMREAPVGWQCSNCVSQDSRTTPVIRWRPSPVGANGRLGNTRITPVTLALIVINVVCYIYEQSHLTIAWESKYFLVPMFVHQHWYSLITSAFLHESFTHIALNMVSLAIVGPAVEAEIGPIRFLVLYLLSALGGSVGFYLLAPQNEAGVGASGAIFGLMGAYFVLAKLRGWPTQTIGVLLVINIFYSFTGGIAWQDHLGGLITGSLVTLGMMWTPGHVRRPSEMAELVQGLAVVIAAMVVLVALLQIPPGHINT
jgi:membrane associated rhomboid family serine protease